MDKEICKATVIFAGLGKDGKIIFYLSKQCDFSTGRLYFTATVVALKRNVNSDLPTITADSRKHAPEFKTFEEAKKWLEERCDEFSVFDFYLVLKN
jgi:hypothetical protein